MNQGFLQFKIAQLRQERAASSLEAIMVMIFCLFAYVFLPQLLFQFIYANQHLTDEPQLLKNLPNVLFIIGAAFFVYTVVMNIMRCLQVARLEKQLMATSAMGMSSLACCSDCGGSCECDEHGRCACGNCEMPAENKTMAATEKMTKVGTKRKTNKKK